MSRIATFSGNKEQDEDKEEDKKQGHQDDDDDDDDDDEEEGGGGRHCASTVNHSLLETQAMTTGNYDGQWVATKIVMAYG